METVFVPLLVTFIIFMLIGMIWKDSDEKKPDPGNVGGEDDSGGDVTGTNDSGGGETEFLNDDVGCNDGTCDIWSSTPTLILRDVEDASRKYKIHLQGSDAVSLGRSNDDFQSVFHADNRTSRRQCEVFVKDGMVMVRNTSQKNITRLNNVGIVVDSELVTGCVLEMGRLKVNVEVCFGRGGSSNIKSDTYILQP